MPISGFSEFKSHLPDYSDKQAKLVVARLPIFALLSLLLSIGIDYSMRIIYLFNPNETLILIEPWFPIIIPLIFIGGGIRTAQLGFLRKNRLIREDKTRAYQKVVKKVFRGIGMVFGGLFYAYIPHYGFLGLDSGGFFPINPITTRLSLSLIAQWTGISWDFYPRFIIGFVILGLMIGTAVRAVKDFGIDNAGLVYVYYPEEAKVVQSDIYSIVRHPMYMAAIMISIGGFCFQFSIYSIIHLIITLLGFTYHILCVEEKELIERFGDSYKTYTKRVPAILIKPENWGRYFKFLIGK